MSRIGGTIFLKYDGTQLNTKGNFTYNLGNPNRSAVVGNEGPHGFTEKAQVPFIEGTISDNKDLDVKELQSVTGATVTLELANGKVFTLREAWFAGEGNITTEEGEIALRFEGMSGEEIK